MLLQYGNRDGPLIGQAVPVQQMIGLYPDRIITVSANELDPLACKQWRGDLLVLGIFEEALSSAGNLQTVTALWTLLQPVCFAVCTD